MSNEKTNDVVGLLKDQHQRIRTMFDAVEQAHGEDRQRRFAELRRFLAVHEPRRRWSCTRGRGSVRAATTSSTPA
ncbi:MAG TPA: hypothetical protein VK964_02780 [Nocardioidaceae bacterium]|nr:hypothetical protein [Nocardioidaceae bacterium]